MERFLKEKLDILGEVKNIMETLDNLDVREYDHGGKHDYSRENSRLRIMNANNGGVLDDDFVYNSPLASRELKKVIRTRQFGSMTRDEFEGAYKAVLYGINSKKYELVLGKDTRDLDTVPTEISRTLSARARHTDSHLIMTCQVHGITLGELEDMIDIKGVYKTNLRSITNLYASGRDISEIKEIFEARDMISNLTGEDKKNRKESISLGQIDTLQKRFEEIPVDGSILSERIVDIHRAMAGRFADKNFMHTSVSNFLEVTENMGIYDFETAMDFVNGKIFWRVNQEIEGDDPKSREPDQRW